jgi:hypothetical protein
LKSGVQPGCGPLLEDGIMLTGNAELWELAGQLHHQLGGKQLEYLMSVSFWISPLDGEAKDRLQDAKVKLPRRLPSNRWCRHHQLS